MRRADLFPARSHAAGHWQGDDAAVNDIGKPPASFLSGAADAIEATDRVLYVESRLL
jgi:hypothetical protein